MDKMIYPWGNTKRYNDFSNHFKILFSERVQKVSIDAGFTCPNRDGSKGVGGCTYCNNRTFKPDYCNRKSSVARQIEEGIEFFARKYESMRFLAYFQAYSNTYAPIETLKELYEEALRHPKIIGLVIATRPDCLNEEILDYLENLSKQVYVMVELGLESCNNRILESINRGHTIEESVWAIRETARRGIHNGAHMILGLPGETREELLLQPAFLSSLPLETLKLHQLQIHKGTAMAREYENDPMHFRLFEVDEYVDLIVDYLELLRPTIIMERFVSQAPAGMLIAPDWGLKNFEFVAKVEKRLCERNTWQGRLYIDL